MNKTNADIRETNVKNATSQAITLLEKLPKQFRGAKQREVRKALEAVYIELARVNDIAASRAPDCVADTVDAFMRLTRRG